MRNMVSPKKKTNLQDKNKALPISPPHSPSFEEPSTPENQTAYSLTMESSRRSRTRTKTQPKINVNEKKGKQLSPISRGRIVTQRSDSSSSSSSTDVRNPPVAKKNPSVLQPQNKSNLQRPGTSYQRNNSSDSSVSNRTPSPRKRGTKQNVENIDPQPGTSRGARQAAENINPQPGTSRGTRQAPEKINPEPGTSRGARQAPENINPQPGASRGVVRKAPIPPVNRRKQKAPTKTALPCLREIYKLQSSTHCLIPKLPFSRLIRELLQSNSLTVTRITPPALIALQESSEMYLTHLLADAYRCTLHRSRVTLTVKDIQLARYLRGAADS